ncbi:hypothetical protein HAX54_010681 [Datura stramonium]|uniref:Uncharacterized protein n=1 Tax=Datura stramonium TaxID=4076 RepID=A0ABS8TGR1_DATST|nr:hypothetical protein [Datura stramonium]
MSDVGCLKAIELGMLPVLQGVILSIRLGPSPLLPQFGYAPINVLSLTTRLPPAYTNPLPRPPSLGLPGGHLKGGGIIGSNGDLTHKLLSYIGVIVGIYARE